MVDRKQLRIATYNVLYCPKIWMIKLFSASKLRYDYQINSLLPALDLDILCLQEWTQEYLKILRENKLSQNYQIFNYESTRAKSHFPLIISRIPFIELLIRDRAIYGLFELGSIYFIVIWVHLNVLGKTKQMREIEFSKINQNLQM